jgi:hypothetical protein
MASRLSGRILLLFNRDAKAGAAAMRIGAIFQRKATAMGLGDLPAEDQADAGATGLGSEKRNEEVGGVG